MKKILFPYHLLVRMRFKFCRWWAMYHAKRQITSYGVGLCVNAPCVFGALVSTKNFLVTSRLKIK